MAEHIKLHDDRLKGSEIMIHNFFAVTDSIGVLKRRREKILSDLLESQKIAKVGDTIPIDDPVRLRGLDMRVQRVYATQFDTNSIKLVAVGEPIGTYSKTVVSGIPTFKSWIIKMY